MSEESSTDAPETAASEDEPAPPSEAEAVPPSRPEPEAVPPPSAPWRRWVAWLRRTSLRVRIVAGVAAAAVIVAIVFLAVPSSAPTPKPAYTSLPAPCGLVSLATLARYLPNPTGTPLTPSEPSTFRTGTCKWSSTTGDEDRTLVAEVIMFASSSAVPDAQQNYNSVASGLGCHCKGVSVSIRPVTGLGDQAMAIFITDGSNPGWATAPNASAPGDNLIVWSSNAELDLEYNATVAGRVLAPDPGKLAWLVSVARAILADLARPVAVSAAPVSPEPHYAGSRDPCRLITTATLARYATGAGVDASPGTSKDFTGARTSICNWTADNVYIELRLVTFPDAASAQRGFFEDAQSFSQSGKALGITGTRWLPDLGEQAVVLDETRDTQQGVEILVWSGNIELDYWYAGYGSYSNSGLPPPTPATLLAGGIAMARDGLAAVARPSTSSYPGGPVYASPPDPCSLVKASTVARYSPGVTYDPNQIPEQVGPISSCSWSGPAAGPGAILGLSLTVGSDADEALSLYRIGLQEASQGLSTIPGDGTQSVPGLGDQATAVFDTLGGSPEVELFLVSGNAEIETTIVDSVLAPALSRAQNLAADVAMARDVLADLARS